MSFPDSDVIAAAESSRLDPIESTHHSDCPQHPWNDVFDVTEPCECEQLALDDAAAASEAKSDLQREDAFDVEAGPAA